MNKKFLLLGTLLCLIFPTITFSQAEIHSGICHQVSLTEENNLIKLHCEALSDEALCVLVKSEYLKYLPVIQDVKIDGVNKKIYIKYTNEITANYLLGILRRLSIDVYYLNTSGEEVRYVKNSSDEFKN
jgi:hypothetical protein